MLCQLLALLLANTIVGVIPILFVIFMVVESHALNVMIAKPDTDIGVRLDVVRCRGRTAAHGELWHGAKPAREVDFVGCSALDPRLAEPLPTAGKDQVNVIGFGLCRTDADEPAAMRNGTCDGDTD